MSFLKRLATLSARDLISVEAFAKSAALYAARYLGPDSSAPLAFCSAVADRDYPETADMLGLTFASAWGRDPTADEMRAMRPDSKRVVDDEASYYRANE